MSEHTPEEEGLPPLKKQKSGDPPLDSTCGDPSTSEGGKAEVEGEEPEENVEDEEYEKENEEEMKERVEVVYIYSDEYIQLCNAIPIHKNRAIIVHSLLEAYGLLNKVKVVPPVPATDDQLTSYHSEEYIEKIKALSKTVPTNQETKEVFQQREGFGLAFDCPPFKRMYEYVQMVAGATVVGATMLCEGECRVAVNPEGGRHRKRKKGSSKWILLHKWYPGDLHKVSDTFSRVLYIDIDIHHGDGVEEAFYLTNKVVTLSLHKHCPGFFPGTGSSAAIGSGRGKNHYNIDDGVYLRIFRELTNEVRTKFAPEVVVLQCGCDTLTGDPLGEWSLTPKLVGECAKWISDWQLPTLVLGGGGYNPTNVARAWVHVFDALNTKDSAASGMQKLYEKTPVSTEKNTHSVSDDIPEHAYFELYGPDFRLSLASVPRNLAWKEEDIEGITAAAKKTISLIP